VHQTPPRRSDAARRTLITGGAGFIGSHLADALLARGDHVTVVDDLSTGRRDNLPLAHERLRFIEANLSDELARFPRSDTFDEIYHLAAAVGVSLILEKPIESIETNVNQTAAVLRFAGQAPRPTPTLIASSSEVYGKGVRSPFSETDDVLYGPTTAGRWSYACSKAIDEYLALAHYRESNLPVVIARFFNTVGPRQVGDYGMVVPRFVRAALAGEDLVVFGDGRQTRCFCHVLDVVDALPRLLASPPCRGRVFNLGSDRQISIADLARLVITTLDSSSKVRLIPYEEAYTEGFEDLRQRQPDLSRINDAIGFEPRRSLDDTIRDIADAMRRESTTC
jgi:UDP-glucose 4-epimerase